MAMSTQTLRESDAAKNLPASDSSDGFSINTLTLHDLAEVLRKGLADFKAMPSHLIFLATIYPIGAFLLGQLTYSFDLLPLFFPLVAGFAIVGPFLAIGLYQISRQREQGLEPHWKDVLEVWHSPSRGSILVVGLALLVIFAAWMITANWLYGLIMGGKSFASVGSFLQTIMTTNAGWTLIIVGHAVGFCFAALAFMISAISFQLLLDRPVDTSTAIRASIMSVRRNPRVMLVWAGIIATGLILGSALLFVGLVIVLPVLAHASWHLYRRVVSWR